MSQSNDDTVVVLVAGYSGVRAAIDAFEAVRAVYEERDADAAAADYCEAAVISPHETDPGSRVLRETPPSRQWHAEHTHAHEGLARRLARYLGEGLALTGGPAGGGGEVIPFDTGEATGPLGSSDLKELGAVQKAASAVLIGIFPAVMSDGITAATGAADSRASKELRASVEQLEAQIVRAERTSIDDAHR